MPASARPRIPAGAGRRRGPAAEQMRRKLPRGPGARPLLYSATVIARVAVSGAAVAEAALDDVASQLAEGGASGCALALILVGTAHGAVEPRALWQLGERIGARHVAVAQVEGLLASDEEWLGRPVLAALALDGDLAVHSIDSARGHEADIGEEIAACLGPLSEHDLVLAIADAHDLDARAFACGLAACAPAALLGVGVEGAAGTHAWHGVDGEVARGGVLAVRLRAARAPGCALAPGLRLRAHRRVDRARGNWLCELSGAPALEEFRDAAGVLWNDEQRARRSVFVALPDGPDGAPHPALARAVVGLDPEAGAIALPEPVEPGASVAFALRDESAARESLAAAAESLETVAASDSGVGFAATCGARGESLFGHAGLEASYIGRALGRAPWIGLVGSFQIAATPGSPASLLTHAGALVRLV